MILLITLLQTPECTMSGSHLAALCRRWRTFLITLLRTVERLNEWLLFGCAVPQMEDLMDMVQSGAVKALELRDKQEELRRTDQNYIKVLIAKSGYAVIAMTPAWHHRWVSWHYLCIFAIDKRVQDACPADGGEAGEELVKSWVGGREGA
jgi:hypothetical protein